MDKLHEYRTHIYVFVLGLAVVTLGIALYSYFYNPTIAQSVPAIQVTTDPSTWKGVNVVLKMHASGTSQQLLTATLMSQIAATGANVIRLNVHCDPDGDDTAYTAFVDANGNVLPAANSQGIADLQAAVALAAQYNIKVIIDMHTFPGTTKGAIWTSQTDWNNLGTIWSTIAATFKNNPNVIAFDLMNEPNVLASLDTATQNKMSAQMYASKWVIPSDWIGTPRDYNAEMAQVMNAVRAVDPNRTLIVEGFGVAGNPINYTWMTPIAGFSNVVYSFHMYEPTGLTLGNSSGAISPFSYPADESKITKWLVAPIAFQQKYNVPMYVGEFGIQTASIFNSAPTTNVPYNGSCWLSSILSTMDAHHWGWTYWTFWPGNLAPVSAVDPRYLLLHADMTGGTISDDCNNLPVLNSAVSTLPTMLSLTPPIVSTPPVTVPVVSTPTPSTTDTPPSTPVDTPAPSAPIVTPVPVETDTDSGTTSGSSYNLNTPTSSGVTETVSQPLTAPVSDTLQFNIQAAAPAVIVTTATTTSTPTGTTIVTTTKPVVTGTQPTITVPKATVVTTKSSATTTTPTKSVVTTTQPVVVSDATQQSTTLTSITYTLDGKLIHTTSAFPDNWNFDTTTIPDGAYNLTAVYHYADGSTRSSITIFRIKNGKTFIESVTGIAEDIWQEILSLIGK